MKFPINEEWHKNTQDQSQVSTFPEREKQKIGSTETEEEKIPSTYKNYIYRGKNWECPICDTEDHCEHYHCT